MIFPHLDAQQIGPVLHRIWLLIALLVLTLMVNRLLFPRRRYDCGPFRSITFALACLAYLIRNKPSSKP